MKGYLIKVSGLCRAVAATAAQAGVPSPLL
jgi:hypothetical protein